MKIREDLIYFLRNGGFKNISFGITKNELVEKIGAPDFVLPEKSKMPTLFEYDNIEFCFENESARLQTIQINSPVSYSKTGNLIFDSYDWKINLTLEKAIEFLNKNNIDFEEKPYPFDIDFFRLFVLESDVQIHFTNQRDENIWELHSFGRTVKLSSIKPKTKQISFEIEKNYYEQLRTEAEKTRISIANLCREIVEKHFRR